MASQPSTPRANRVAGLLPLLGVTAGILFVGGMLTTYQAVLDATYRSTLALSPPEWVLYTFGAFLVEPVLLVGVLYYVGTRHETTATPRRLLTGVGVAVVVGSVLGQHAGVSVWGGAISSGAAVPLVTAWSGLFGSDPASLSYWYALVEPLVRDYLTVVAAIGLARILE